MPKEKRVVTEDYFRVLKEQREANTKTKDGRPVIGSAISKSILESAH